MSDVFALYASCVMGLGRDTGRFDTGSTRGTGTDVMVGVIAHGGRIGGNWLEILAATSACISEPNCCVSA